jgi:hypothetical protein
MKNILRENMRRFRTKNLLTEENRIDAIIDYYLNGKEVNSAAKELLTTIKDRLTKMEFRFYAANKKVNSAPEKKAEYDTTQQVIMKSFKGDLANLGMYGGLILPLFKEGTSYTNDFLRGGANWYQLNTLQGLFIGKEFQQAADLVNTTYTELEKLFK